MVTAVLKMVLVNMLSCYTSLILEVFGTLLARQCTKKKILTCNSVNDRLAI